MKFSGAKSMTKTPEGPHTWLNGFERNPAFHNFPKNLSWILRVQPESLLKNTIKTAADTQVASSLHPSPSTLHPPLRLASDSGDSELDLQLHLSSGLEAEPETVVLRAESPPLASAFALPTSFEEDVLDLK